MAAKPLPYLTSPVPTFSTHFHFPTAMSSKALISVLISLFSLFISPSSSAFLAPITKHQHHHSNPYYTVSIYLKTPLQPTELLLDIGAAFSWIDCTHNYTSATSHAIPCNSALCFTLHSCSSATCLHSAFPPACTANDSCALFPQNSFTRKGSANAEAVALADSLALPVTDGVNPGPLNVFPEFVFSCSETSVLKGHAKGVTGLAGFGTSQFSLPAQVGAAVSSQVLFALCLSGSPSAPGVAFFNTPGPYSFLPGIDLSKSLNYTPILESPGEGSTVAPYNRHSDGQYFIGVTSIKVNGKPVRFNRTLLAVDPKGYGGTKISTIHPYTVLQSSIFKAIAEAFVNESIAMRLSLTKPVKPFSVCFKADGILETRVGPSVPTVDLVMQKDDVFWRMFGSNSMVRIVRDEIDAWCLGFVNGGAKAKTSIVIGAHQMEENLLQFDLGLKRLGFSSVLVHNTMCANFNFTKNDNLKPF